ncbi:unnamed protein product [Blepharisma stoltei]|uniref:Uncharacterized protein n=1 Tax=Blepharisma stoltei TaxID=1481888 RepID=A0AAU9J415_9CILI|nr:unnamed protein product [Blepharisma stoltei]
MLYPKSFWWQKFSYHLSISPQHLGSTLCIQIPLIGNNFPPIFISGSTTIQFFIPLDFSPLLSKYSTQKL